MWSIKRVKLTLTPLTVFCHSLVFVMALIGKLNYIFNMEFLHVCFVLRYLLVRAALAIMAFCSSSRPAELADVTFSQVTRDELDRGVWFKKIHAKNKKGTSI